jgi:hypothetical protein
MGDPLLAAITGHFHVQEADLLAAHPPSVDAFTRTSISVPALDPVGHQQLQGALPRSGQAGGERQQQDSDDCHGGRSA